MYSEVINTILGRPFQIKLGVVYVVVYIMVTSMVLGASSVLMHTNTYLDMETMDQTQGHKSVVFLLEAPATVGALGP